VTLISGGDDGSVVSSGSCMAQVDGGVVTGTRINRNVKLVKAIDAKQRRINLEIFIILYELLCIWYYV
jgi:hypothetical protein